MLILKIPNKFVKTIEIYILFLQVIVLKISQKGNNERQNQRVKFFILNRVWFVNYKLRENIKEYYDRYIKYRYKYPNLYWFLIFR